MSLKEISIKSCSGGTPKKGIAEFYENGTVPWLRTQEVVYNEIYKTDCFITEEAVKKTSAKWIPTNCVIVAISGASAGRCAINKIPLTTNQHCLNIEMVMRPYQITATERILNRIEIANKQHTCLDYS